MSGRLVLVDIDGTLLRRTGSEPRFALWLVRQRALGLRQLLAFVAFAIRYAPRYGRHILRKNKAWLSGLKITDLQRLAHRFAAEQLEFELNPQVMNRIAEHRAAGDRVVLLSGTLQPIADWLAERVGGVEACATLCAHDGESLRAGPPRRHPFGKRKLELARQLAARHALELGNSVAYGDSGYDLELLDAVGCPVAVRPDSVLAATARRRGWEIIPAV